MSECPLGWEVWGRHCYYFSPLEGHLSWSGAEAECRRRNATAQLPSVATVEEDKFIQNNTLGRWYLVSSNIGGL